MQAAWLSAFLSSVSSIVLQVAFSSFCLQLLSYIFPTHAQDKTSVHSPWHSSFLFPAGFFLFLLSILKPIFVQWCLSQIQPLQLALFAESFLPVLHWNWIHHLHQTQLCRCLYSWLVHRCLPRWMLSGLRHGHSHKKCVNNHHSGVPSIFSFVARVTFRLLFHQPFSPSSTMMNFLFWQLQQQHGIAGNVNHFWHLHGMMSWHRLQPFWPSGKL